MTEEIKEYVDRYVNLIMGRFDRLDHFMEVMSGRHNMIDGVRLLDNQDLCQMLNVSKRTLQRYRSLGVLPYQFIYHKIFYKEPDVEAFILSQFYKGEKNREDPDGDQPPTSSGDDAGSDPEGTDN